MKTIWKYPLEIRARSQKIRIPQGAEILTVQNQDSEDELDGQPQLWALVDADAMVQVRRFRVVATYGAVDFLIKRYIATFRLGSSEFHVFEEV